MICYPGMKVAEQPCPLGRVRNNGRDFFLWTYYARVTNEIFSKQGKRAGYTIPLPSYVLALCSCKNNPPDACGMDVQKFLVAQPK